jgi:hypothetical protein
LLLLKAGQLADKRLHLLDVFALLALRSQKGSTKPRRQWKTVMFTRDDGKARRAHLGDLALEATRRLAQPVTDDLEIAIA